LAGCTGEDIDTAGFGTATADGVDNLTCIPARAGKWRREAAQNGLWRLFPDEYEEDCVGREKSIVKSTLPR
jgi:hypothetical protein